MTGVPRKPPWLCRLGLCCQFVEQPIKFRTTSAARVLRLAPDVRLHFMGDICIANVASLAHAIRFCARHGIGAFRVGSWLFPVATHPQVGYQLGDLPQAGELCAALDQCRELASENDVRLTFHPDQFVVLNSPRPEVVDNAIRDLEHHTRLAECIGADVINIHAGGAYGDKASALRRFAANLERLSAAARSRLTLENDDTVFTPADLLPLCRSENIPLVYDVHHHRCLDDGLSVAAASEAALETWDREPLFHISSPIAGWSGPYPERHHDCIDYADVPRDWPLLPVTIEVEAKAKELAVLRLQDDLARRGMLDAPTSNAR